MGTVTVEFPNLKDYTNLPEGFTLDRTSFVPEASQERSLPPLNDYTEENLFQYEMRKQMQDYAPSRQGPPGEAPSPQEGNLLAGDIPPGFQLDQPVAAPPSPFYGPLEQEEAAKAPGKRGTPSKGLLLSEDEEGKVTLNAWENIKRFMQTGDEKAAFRIVSTLAGGGTLRSGMASKSELGVFGGKLAKGFEETDLLQKYLGREGAVKFEIPDTGMKWNSGQLAKRMQTQTELKLDTVLEHPELYKNYPEAGNIAIIPTKDMPKGSATFEENINSIRMNPSDIGTDEGKGIVIHEIQHWIQKAEKFARGGSVGGAEGYRSLVERIQNENITPDALLSIKNGPTFVAGLVNAVGELIDRPVSIDQAFTVLNKIKSFKKPVVLDAIGEKMAMHMYLSLGGEVEARNVASRLANPELMKKPPAATEDISGQFQIIETKAPKISQSFGGKPPGNIDELTATRATKGSANKNISKADEALSDAQLSADMEAEQKARDIAFKNSIQQLSLDLPEPVKEPALKLIEGGLLKTERQIEQITKQMVDALKKPGEELTPEDTIKINTAIKQIRSEAKAYTRETNDMLPQGGNPSKDTLEYLGMTKEEWRQGILDSLDRELAPSLKSIRGGKDISRENPIPVITSESLDSQLKAAKQMYNKLSGKGEQEPKVNLYRTLFHTLQRAVDVENSVRLNDKLLKDFHLPNTSTHESLRVMRDFLVEHAAKIRKEIDSLNKSSKEKSAERKTSDTISKDLNQLEFDFRNET